MEKKCPLCGCLMVVPLAGEAFCPKDCDEEIYWDHVHDDEEDD